MAKQWICSTDNTHVFNEPTKDMFCPKCNAYSGVLIETLTDGYEKKSEPLDPLPNNSKPKFKTKKLLIAVIPLLAIGLFFMYNKINTPPTLAISPNTNHSIKEDKNNQSQENVFQFAREKPINGKLKAVVEMGAQGFNYFIIEVDSDKNWMVRKKEFGNSLVKEKFASGIDIKQGLKEFIKQIVNYGVESQNVHFIISSGALKQGDVVDPIILGLKDLGYIVNTVTPEKEALYVYKCLMPDEFKDNGFVLDIGSGNTKIAYWNGSLTKTFETYGAKYYQDNKDPKTVFEEVKEMSSSISKRNTEICFVIGGVPFQLAESLKTGDARYTQLKTRISDYNELAKKEGIKLESGLNIYNAVIDGTGCKKFIFDWDANFSIGFLLSLTY